MEQFQNKHITKALSIPHERFRSWIASGYVEPSIQKSSGRGVYNVFSRWDIYTIGLFIHLTEMGIDYKRASGIAKQASSAAIRGLERADYLVIRYIPSGGINYSFVESPSLIFDLKRGLFTEGNEKEHSQRKEREKAHDSKYPLKQSWSDFLIVNFAMICEKVDQALWTLNGA